MTALLGTVPFITRHGRAEADYIHEGRTRLLEIRLQGMRIQRGSPLWLELKPMARVAAEEEVRAMREVVQT